MKSEKVDYAKAPKIIQDLIDNYSEGLTGVYKIYLKNINGKVYKIAYRFDFEEGFEIWSRWFDVEGKVICETPYMLRESWVEEEPEMF
jgi:hypothetical protein